MEGTMTVGSNTATIVKGGAQFTAEQGSDYAPGVSAEAVGSQNLFLGVVTLPPGKRTKAHVHERHETAMYFLSGTSVDMYTGPALERHEVMHPGDYVYIPANVLHVAVNRTDTPAVFVGSRNEATVNESVVFYPEMDARVP
jgi:uncharacterized RmlC-like cupin family protein